MLKSVSTDGTFKVGDLIKITEYSINPTVCNHIGQIIDIETDNNSFMVRYTVDYSLSSKINKIKGLYSTDKRITPTCIYINPNAIASLKIDKINRFIATSVETDYFKSSVAQVINNDYFKESVRSLGSMVEELENKQVIIIKQMDNGEIGAFKFNGKGLVATATAKCSPKDDFNFMLGANIALNRLV